MKTVFVHPERCIGCKQCEAACAVAHSQSKNLFWAVFEDPTPKPRIHAEPGLTLNTAFPNKCRHCDPAPCILTCPTTAISRAQDYPEIVLIDLHKCISCAMCALVCPFDVITYYASAEAPEKATVATKCDHCIQRQREGQIPACVEVCKVGALVFGEINELIRAARTRYSEVVSAAVGKVPEELTTIPDTIEGWRAWGAAVTSLNKDSRKGA
ncbi:MAG: 4Fe-4S dicluster domain-containing protein [Anaerolineales bacterium]|nr:4Fe-4S dicluster domain-containing protein [Anaerolineales bacterium]